MIMPNKFYITTTLPYVNSDPHIGFAMEIIRADVIARYKRLLGFEVFFNTGTDEHGLKIYQKAFDFGENTKAYVDRYVEKFKSLKDSLGLIPELNFTRTTDPHHKEAAQEFWKICRQNGYIYLKNYKAKYCVGCELERTESEIEDGHCFLHPHLELIIIEEENYFFAFKKFQDRLLKFYEEKPDFVIPESRFREIKSFVGGGLEDFSISRLAAKMPWGIEVPGDKNHVMYVWFDALVNYISAIGWPDDLEKFNKWQIETGGMVQYCGKDNLRQQAAMWQAMLMAAGLPLSRHIIIDGFIIGAGGVKMSKSLGNVISPTEIVAEYGTDALRYYVAREIHPFEDTPFSRESFKEAYNANLANGLGNLVSRVMKMAETNLNEPVSIQEDAIPQEFFDLLEKFEIQKATDLVWQKIAEADKMIQDTQPFKLVKADKEKGIEIIKDLVVRLNTISNMLVPVMPETANKILTLIKENKVPEAPLFLRKD